MGYMKLTWDEARYKCAGIGGYLPVLETESEENEIKRIILGSRFLPRKDATPVFSRARQQKQSIIYLGKMLSKVGRIFIFSLLLPNISAGVIEGEGDIMILYSMCLR